MTAIEIIECMCYLGETNGMGTFFNDSHHYSVKETIINLFVPKDMHYVCDGIIHTDRHYLYKYNDRLSSANKGEIGADAVIEVVTENGVVKDRVYLYEIE